MNAKELFARLLVVFPRTKMSDAQSALYVQRLGHLKEFECERALDTAIERHKFKSIPSIAELLAWGQGKEPGKARAKSDHNKWPSVERTRQLQYGESLRRGSPEYRGDIAERNAARFEAMRRASGRPVGSSHFASCVCVNPAHPHSLDDALAKYGLDHRGEPVEEKHRKPWEEVQSAEFGGKY